MRPAPTLGPDISVTYPHEDVFASPVPTVCGGSVLSDGALHVMRPVWALEQQYCLEVENELNRLLFDRPGEAVDVSYGDGKRLRLTVQGRLCEIVAVKSVPERKYLGKPAEPYRKLFLGLAPWKRNAEAPAEPSRWYPAWGVADPFTLTQVLEIAARRLHPQGQNNLETLTR